MQTSAILGIYETSVQKIPLKLPLKSFATPLPHHPPKSQDEHDERDREADRGGFEIGDDVFHADSLGRESLKGIFPLENEGGRIERICRGGYQL